METPITPNTVTVTLHFVVENVGFGFKHYNLHVFHGVPERPDWWKTNQMLVSLGMPLELAKVTIDVITGTKGSHTLFPIVSSRCANAEGELMSLYEY